MVFPWVGIFEQLRLADVFVHYDDVQLPLGRSFITRVQVKNATGIQWLSVPVTKAHTLARINEATTNESKNWRQAHLDLLSALYADAPFKRDMLELVEDVYASPEINLAALNAKGIERIARYFDLECSFRTSSLLGVEGRSSERLLSLVKELDGSVYVTGHGARNYLDHELFERHNIGVEYMQYRLEPYSQLHGEFNPYVSILDLIANVGSSARSIIASSSIPWREFLS